MKATALLSTTALGLALTGLAACGSAYDRQEAIDEFVGAGLTEEQAICVIDDLEVSIGVERLGERGVNVDDLTPEENQAITEATTRCLLGG